LIFNFNPDTLTDDCFQGCRAMIVCHCNGVSDRAIRRSVRSGAVTTDLVASACGAGACCGGCIEAVEEILLGELQTAAAGTVVSGPEHSVTR
jgi:bacterioferritin-associated ferredoxin